ncbi:uncharacterized protein LOC6550323 [Drosophila erecta]|uniref:Uncharacterized protein n=1 Tax=Drosophila erecta TaxID=7220 RepID=B3NTZ0_DROER|nr:uncharacterized protein LOC6550323 [Drosophila erecta]EDV45698.1 uncharacterized protein Dere_GG18642 [Drosophila erecta]
MAGQRFLIVLIVVAILVPSIPEISAKTCGSRHQLRTHNEPVVDLSLLSAKQLKQLVQQLAKLQTQKDEDGGHAVEQDEEAEEEEDPNQDQELEDPEDDHRGGSRPWNRLQRIIRRQLVKIPKRYLKKLLRQFGLARSAGYGGVRSANWGPQLEEYYLIPLE